MAGLTAKEISPSVTLKSPPKSKSADTSRLSVGAALVRDTKVATATIRIDLSIFGRKKIVFSSMIDD
jgi:hypothetical protein